MYKGSGGLVVEAGDGLKTEVTFGRVQWWAVSHDT